MECPFNRKNARSAELDCGSRNICVSLVEKRYHMRIGICDDSQQELQITENWCRKYFEQSKFSDLEVELVCSTEWENLAGQELDLLLLDIEMPERDGISIKEEIGNGERPLIVFVTGYEEYMPRAFGKNVIGFVQ